MNSFHTKTKLFAFCFFLYIFFDLVRKRLTKEIKLLTENPTPGMYVTLVFFDYRFLSCSYFFYDSRRVVEDFTDMRK